MVRSRGSAARTTAGPLRRAGRSASLVSTYTVRTAMRYRVTGLAAEAAFFAILSLPPLIFGLAGAIGYVANTLTVQTIAGLRVELLELASRALTSATVSSVLAPTLDDVLAGGRFDIISIGFLLALWSGSRALNVFVDTITIMYGLSGHRGIIRTRALSFALYVVFVVVGVVVLPLVLAGPAVVHRILPMRFAMVAALYWPVVLLGSILVLATLYHLSVPVRTRWLGEFPGAGLTLVIWIAGSYLLRLILDHSANSSTVYGPLAAPIALLMWLYVVALAVLIGAAFNAATDHVWPNLSGLHQGVEGPRPAADRSDGSSPRARLAQPRPTFPEDGCAPPPEGSVPEPVTPETAAAKRHIS